jgi:CHAT domain-containing protein
VATLWPVEDASTHEVMQAFYRLREAQPGLSKAEALQQAQRQLLAGPGPHVATAPEHTRSPVVLQKLIGG